MLEQTQFAVPFGAPILRESVPRASHLAHFSFFGIFSCFSQLLASTVQSSVFATECAPAIVRSVAPDPRGKDAAP